MASPRVFIPLFTLLLVVDGYDSKCSGGSLTIELPIRSVANMVGSSSDSSDEMEHLLTKLKHHVDESLAYMSNKFKLYTQNMVDRVIESCGKVPPPNVSAIENGVPPNASAFPVDEEFVKFRTEIGKQLKLVRDEQLRISQKLANVSHTDLGLARVEKNLQELALDVQVYQLNPDNRDNGTFTVLSCRARNRLFGDDWTVVQQRYDGTVNFYRNWTDYRDGFGEVGGEFWLGLEKLHRILNATEDGLVRAHELMIELEDVQGVTAFAYYDEFEIGGETENYKLKVLGKYTGTAGDSLTIHKGNEFSTFDRKRNACPEFYHGAWWFVECYDSHLNGEYLHGEQKERHGVIWHTFRGDFESLKATKMMIRPRALIDGVYVHPYNIPAMPINPTKARQAFAESFGTTETIPDIKG